MTQFSKQAVNYIQTKCPNFTAQYGIILGSGLGPLANEITNATVIPFHELPGFPACTVEGHEGALYLGYIKNVPVVCLQGRAHLYEGTANETLQAMTRTLKLLGCHTLLGTNASGSLRAEIPPGHLVLVNDHINMQFNNPLVGPNDDSFGPRFIGMEDAYDPELREKFHKIATTLNIPLEEGVYIGVLGPSFETPAEIRAFRTLGADLVGMSTIPEVICARHCNMKVCVIAVVTNLAAGMSEQKLSHEVTLSGAAKAQADLIQLVLEFFNQISHDK